MPKISNKIMAPFFGFLVGIAILIWLSVFQNQQSENNLEIVFCDVGQGDAIIVEPGLNEQILIDGGPDNSVLSCLGENMPFNDRKIESIIITHPHADHIAGLIDVINKYQIGNIWLTGVAYSSPEYTEILSLIKNKQIQTKKAQIGQIVFQQNQIKLKILYPIKNLQGKTMNNPNNSSVVIRLEDSKFSAIFMGDLEQDAQTEFLSHNQMVKSTVLKVSHHGSSNALMTEFLSQVNPEVAIISVGANNRYGHPTKKTLDLLKQIPNIKILRTDQNGIIEINTNGQTYQVKTAK
ncbi:MAG TPA: MBL fold metallo-hydrolase [Patescibacteria group bacterium]|nr:MBL fold metallo-hydrolase [Patescibacteria group bacterium]